MSGEYDKSLFEDSIFLKGGSGLNLNINGSSKNNILSVVNASANANSGNSLNLPRKLSKKSSVLSGEDLALNSLQVPLREKPRKISFSPLD